MNGVSNSARPYSQLVVVLERISLEPYLKKNAKAPVQKTSKKQSSHLDEQKNLFSILQKSGNSGNCEINYVPYVNVKQKVDRKSENSGHVKLKNFDQVITLFNQTKNRKENFLKHGELINIADVTDLKSLNMMKTIATEKLVQFLKNLELMMKEGEKDFYLSLNETSTDMKTSIRTIEIATNSCLVLLHIMTSPEMPKRIYLEEIINNIVSFINFFLNNVVFPLFDDKCHNKNCKQDVFNIKHRKLPKETKMAFYPKSKLLIKLFIELLSIQSLTETAIFQICLVAFSSLSIENIMGLQLSFMKLLTNVFDLYDEHRTTLLEMCLKSMLQLSSEQRQMRNYRLSNGKYIHIFSAVIVQLIQSVAILPKKFCENRTIFDNTSQIDKIVLDKYEQAKITAGTFLTMFLTKCDKKFEDSNCKILFENFIYDLLAMINKPEWPSTELILSILGIILVNNFSNKETDAALRMISVEFLSILIMKLRKDNKSLEDGIGVIDDLIKNIKSRDLHSGEDSKSLTGKEYNKEKMYLQKLLLYYLFLNSEINEFHSAQHFFIVHWYVLHTKENKPENAKSTSKEPSSSKSKSKIRKRSRNKQIIDKGEIKIKQELINMLQPVLESPIQVICKNVDHKSAELIVQYLTVKQEFLENFDQFLKSIILLLKETTIVIKIKTLKCLMMIIETDVSLLTKHEVQIGLNHTFLDQAASVREVTAELIGKFISKHPDLINDFYDTLSARILDTSVSVRKRIIRIFYDVCITYDNFSKTTEIYIKMIRRINDEESVQKLVMEVFLNIWFTPHNNKSLLLQKVTNIINVVRSDEISLDSFRRLVLSLYELQKVKQGIQNSLVSACKQIIQHLIKNLPKDNENVTTSLRLLLIFSQIEPQLIAEYARILQPYLNSYYDAKIISIIVQIFKQIVPVIPQKKSLFLYDLEEDLMRLVMKHDHSVVASSLSCLGLLTNVTCNFQLIKNCFKKCYDYLIHFKSCLSDSRSNDTQHHFRRALFIIGLLLRYFDISNLTISGGLPENIKHVVCHLFLFFLQQDDEHIQLSTVKAVGLFCLKHNEFLLNNTLKEFYRRALVSEGASFSMKLSVLRNIEMYITEANTNIATHESKVIAKITEDFKKIEDSSGIISSTIQYYVKDILQSYLHPSFQIRQVAFRLVQMILQQGVTHPVQAAPYLICMSSDTEKVIANNADQQLLEINRTYPGYIHAKSSLGLKLSYQLHEKLCKVGIIRGFQINSSNKRPLAMNGFLYSLFKRFKKQRRSFILNILQQFDEDDMNSSLSYLLYLADNLAYFIYETQEELLFLIHHIDRIVAYSGECILQSFKQGLKADDQENSNNSNTSIIDEDGNETVLLEQLPDDISSLQLCLTSSQRFLLLLLLKQHLKQNYGVTDYKIQQYCPEDTTKLYEKPVNRRKGLKFDPKPIISQLGQGSSLSPSDANERKHLVHQYLYFKQLMLEYDSTDPDKEANGNNNTSNCLATSHISQSSELKRRQSRASEQQKIKINKRRRKRQKFSYFSNGDYDTEESDSE